MGGITDARILQIQPLHSGNFQEIGLAVFPHREGRTSMTGTDNVLFLSLVLSNPLSSEMLR